MTQPLWVATRKGLFQLRAETDWRVGTPSFLGDPVAMVLDDARDGTVYAALNLGHFGAKLHRSADRGATWEEVAVPSYAGLPDIAKPPGPGRRHAAARAADAEDALGARSRRRRSARAAVGRHAAGRRVQSDDRGATWDDLPQPVGRAGARRSGSAAATTGPACTRCWSIRAIHGTCWSACRAAAPGRATTTAPRGACRATGMRADYMPPERQGDPVIQDPHRIVRCAGGPDALWTQHHCGVFRSTRRRPAVAGGRRGAAVGVRLRRGRASRSDPDTAWFVPAVKDERRVPVDGKLVVSRTTDGGKTFEVLDRGLAGAVVRPGLSPRARRGRAPATCWPWARRPAACGSRPTAATRGDGVDEPAAHLCRRSTPCASARRELARGTQPCPRPSSLITCPYCGEEVEIYLEPDTRGVLVQDCEVCCNPWQLRVVTDGDER